MKSYLTDTRGEGLEGNDMARCGEGKKVDVTLGWSVKYPRRAGDVYTNMEHARRRQPRAGKSSAGREVSICKH